MTKYISLAQIAEPKGFASGPFGSNLVSKDYAASGVPVIRGSNMLSSAVIGGEFAFVTQEKFNRDLKSNSALSGDIIFTQRGTLGQVAVVPDSFDGPLVISQSQMRLRTDRSRFDTRYVLAACRSDHFKRQIADHAITGGVPHINLGILKELVIPEHPLDQQRAIGEVLGALDDKIAANRESISIAKELIQAQWEGLSAAASDVRSLDEIADLNPRTPLHAEGPHPFLDMKELPQNGLLADRWSSRETRSGSKFRNGDTLLARITPCFENGKAGLVDFLSADVTGLGSTEYIVLRPKDGVPQAVPYCIATSDAFRAHAARGMTGTSGRQRVQASNVGDYPVGWPDQDALDKFGGFTDALVRRLGAARNENAQLARTRDELLPLLMSGRITVKDTERAAEDVL